MRPHSTLSKMSPCGQREPGKLDAFFNLKALRKGWHPKTKMTSSSHVEMGRPAIARIETSLFSKNNLGHILAIVNGTPIVLAALDEEWPTRMRPMTCECSCCLSAILKRNGETNRQWCQRPILNRTIPCLNYPGTNILEREDATHPLTHTQRCHYI